MDRLLKTFNANFELRKNLHYFKEAFVEFYGEEKRKEIEEAFSKILPIGYITPEEFVRNLRDLELEITNKLLKDILKDKKIPLNIEDLIDKKSFEYFTVQPIYYYLQFYKKYKIGKEERTKEFFERGYNEIHSNIRELSKDEFEEIIKNKKLPEKFEYIPKTYKEDLLYLANEKNCLREYRNLFKEAEPLLKKVIPEIDFSNFQDYQIDPRMQELNKVLKEYELALEKYSLYKESLKDLYVQEKQLEKSKQELRERHYKNFIREFQDLIPKNQRSNLSEYLNDEKEEYTLDPYIKYFFGNSLYSTTPLEYFSQDAENILNSDEDWNKNDIIQNRIEYFKKNGIDLGADYKQYLESPEVQKIWPPKELIEIFIKAKNKHLNNFNNEFYTTTTHHKKIRSEIDSLNLLDKDDLFDAHIYLASGGATFITPNIRKSNLTYELFSLLIVSFNNYNDNYKDHNIVHELNHIYELYLQLVGENEYIAVCGWDIVSGKLNQEKEVTAPINLDREKRPYELFNEIINELIAQEISKIMHKNNIHIFDKKETAKYKHGTNYEYSLFIVEDFFNEFKDKIIESRRNDNIQVIFDEVGKENFEELNNLFKTFNEHFSGFKIYNVINSIDNNEDTELTRIYYDLKNRKEKIMENMRIHQANKKIEDNRKEI